MEIDKNSKISITFCRIFGVPVQRDVKLGGAMTFGMEESFQAVKDRPAPFRDT